MASSRYFLLVLSICQLLLFPLAAWAADANADADTLANHILQKEIELLRLNTRFRIETTDRSRLKPWRVFAYNLAASGVSNAGIDTIAAERWRTWRRPATANRNTLKAGPTLLLIGHSISLGGILIEASLDLVNDYRIKRKGFDVQSTKRRAVQLQMEIDDLIEKRKATSIGQQDVAEGLILKDLRDIAVSDYAQSYVRARKRKMARNVSYLNGAAAAATGGYLGSLCGLLAVADRKPRLAGPAGIGFTLSGAHIAAAPIVQKVAAELEGKRAKGQLAHDLLLARAQATSDLDTHFAELKSLLATSSDRRAQKRLAIYEKLNSITDEQTAMNKKEKQKSDFDFKERLLFNAAVGGTKMGWGIQLANAGFGFHPRPAAPTVNLPVQVGGRTVRVALPRPRGANELFAHRVAQGATTYIPGTGIWILDTLQARARGERELYSMGSQDALPHQKLNARLAQLDQLEKLLSEM